MTTKTKITISILLASITIFSSVVGYSIYSNSITKQSKNSISTNSITSVFTSSSAQTTNSLTSAMTSKTPASPIVSTSLSSQITINSSIQIETNTSSSIQFVRENEFSIENIKDADQVKCVSTKQYKYPKNYDKTNDTYNEKAVIGNVSGVNLNNLASKIKSQNGLLSEMFGECVEGGALITALNTTPVEIKIKNVDKVYAYFYAYSSGFGYSSASVGITGLKGSQGFVLLDDDELLNFDKLNEPCGINNGRVTDEQANCLSKKIQELVDNSNDILKSKADRLQALFEIR